MIVTRRRLLSGGATAVALGLAGCTSSPVGTEWSLRDPLAVTDAHQFNAEGCSCCEQYASYLDDNLDGSLEVTVPEDIVAVKRRYGVPEEYWSCHTLDLEGYVVEGHVPVTVIARLLEEAPEIDGIALPGMPAGSPGMGGTKSAVFTVFEFGGGRTGAVYVEL